MQINKIVSNRIIKNEEATSKFINILTHYDADTLLDKNGRLIKIFKLSGINFTTADGQTLDIFKARRNNLFKTFSSEFALYSWYVRRKFNQYPQGEFANDFAREVNAKYIDQIKNSKMFHGELYLAIVTKQPEGLINKSFSIFNYFNYYLDKQAKQNYLVRRHKELNDITHNILTTFSEYNCETLSVYEINNQKFSEPLKFISQLVNFDAYSVPLKTENASKTLPRKRVFFNNRSGTIEMREACGAKKFAAMLSIKGYTPITQHDILDKLLDLRCEYTITQSFRFYDRQLAKNKLRDQQKDMLQLKDESISQIVEIDEVFDDTASGEIGFGKHHFSLACFADTQDALDKNVGLIVSTFSDVNIVCVREDIACELAFWAQLPGNFAYIVRSADISSKNMASFASLHNTITGKITGNHWGPSVTVFETISGNPYYFNFHHKDVGNFLVFGAMGSGKTVLIGFLILQSMKFGGKRIIFDKDRGLEILVRAMGGVYEIIKPGIPTKFNPCQLSDSPENRKFLASLLKKMLTVNGEMLTESEVDSIEKAIEGMYRLSQSSRQLKHIASFFGTKMRGSLRARFDQWHSDGPHAWLFDNEIDSLNLNSDVLGFDLGNILADHECKTPALMYLTYRVEEAIEGHRAILFIDEGWLALNDDYFKRIIEDWSRTPRKKNNIFGLATQTVNDTISAPISKSINESAFCKIFFPNPSAEQKVYVDGFGLSEHEFKLIKTLPDDQHFFLHVYGSGANKNSVVLRANLANFKDEIAIISARENSLTLLDQIRSEVGDDPNIWLPIFKEKLKGHHE